MLVRETTWARMLQWSHWGKPKIMKALGPRNEVQPVPANHRHAWI